MTSYYPLLAEFRTLLNQLADEDPANKHAKSLLIEHFKEEIGTVILSYFLYDTKYFSFQTLVSLAYVWLKDAKELRGGFSEDPALDENLSRLCKRI
mmetsp:Transcript_27222/g.43806  ORF Transcript_27222/g.43806 Transcript_27222/m.43806 type:complete len:96 (+) Transcript_27222:601-888(+)